MTNYKCEDVSLCIKFQAAICLHCNRRLCVPHITEHDKIVFDEVKNLSNSVEVIYQEIKDKSKKSRSTYNDILPSLSEWRVEQLEKIEDIHQNELELIGFQQEALQGFHRELLEQLGRDAQQPLERMQRQQNTNVEILNHIRQTIKTVEGDAVHLKWDFSALPSGNIEYSHSDFPPIPVPVEIPITDGIKQMKKQSATNEKSSSGPSTYNIVKMRKGCPRKRLVRMFADISAVKQSKIDIDIYINNQKSFLNLPILINSYLTAWCKQSKASNKTLLLNQHISTVQKHLPNLTASCGVLVGIQIFFFNAQIPGNKCEIMRFLLQFFLDHQCITQKLILDWYNDNDTHDYVGFPEVRQLVKPFIKSLTTIGTDNSDSKGNGAQAASA